MLSSLSKSQTLKKLDTLITLKPFFHMVITIEKDMTSSILSYSSIVPSKKTHSISNKLHFACQKIVNSSAFPLGTVNNLSNFQRIPERECYLFIGDLVLHYTRIDRGRFIPFVTFFLVVYSRSWSIQEVGLFS